MSDARLMVIGIHAAEDASSPTGKAGLSYSTAIYLLALF